MEKEKILSEIMARIGKTSLSQRTLTDYVNANLPAEGTEPDDAFWERHVGFLKSLDGNFSHDVSTQVEEFKKSYKPQSQQQPPTEADDDMKKRLEALEKEREQERANKHIESLRNGVLGKYKELKVSNKSLWDDVVKTVAYQEGMTAEEMLTEAKRGYETKLKAYLGEGEVPYGGEQRGGSPQISSEEANAKREAFRQKMIAQGRLPDKKEN